MATADELSACGKAELEGHPAHQTLVCAPAQRYIYSVLKEIHPDRSISTRAMGIMNSFMEDMFTRLAAESARLLRMTGKKTLSSREVRAPPHADRTWAIACSAFL